MSEAVRVPNFDQFAIQSRGWSFCSLEARDETEFRGQLLAIAEQFGTPTPTRLRNSPCDALMPISAAKAQPRSLSKIHSEGAFPLHTDTAHWVTPCHYIMLGCVNSGIGNRSTRLLDTHTLVLSTRQQTLLHSVPLRITNGRNSFFSTILSNSRQFVRFDPGCMTATTPDGIESLAVLSQQNWQEEIETFNWQPGKVLIMDNWRVLHGRNDACRPDHDRKLLRISIQ